MADLRITFTRREAGSYVHTATGIEIHRGESGKWFVYLPHMKGITMAASRPTKALAEVAARLAVAAQRAAIEAAHTAALHEAAERIVQQGGADALIHFYNVDMATPCGVDLTTTPYTYGSPENAEVTCPACIGRFAPIRL